jgi:sec-independent protein translocase protein TatA
MGSMSIWHWIVVIAVVLLLFGGRGKISELMGDFAKGIKAFRKGMTEEEKSEPAKTEAPKSLEHQPAPATSEATASPDLQHRAATEKKFEGGTV